MAVTGSIGMAGDIQLGLVLDHQGNLYSDLGKQSAAILVLDNAVALMGRLIPLGLGLAAQNFGLYAAMWLLLLGPLALLVGLPRKMGDQPSRIAGRCKEV
ncbi:hypothetical protein [Ornatilinea apprima]|uniref:hypothetical protein n=1 Tax=Ornatilinea apprima TaxID=1134406 RepID=UPI00128F0FE9|nr:hypothetical protein [Ornatilinea apprima]